MKEKVEKLLEEYGLDAEQVFVELDDNEWADILYMFGQWDFSRKFVKLLDPNADLDKLRKSVFEIQELYSKAIKVMSSVAYD